MYEKPSSGLIVTLVIIGSIVFLICTVLFLWYVNRPFNTLKTAVTEDSIEDPNFILCQIVETTGYHWKVIGDSSGVVDNQLCNIDGPTPQKELNLNTEFLISENIYVFYVEDSCTYYDENIKGDNTVYLVSGWDILFPVKHGRFDSFLDSKWHITTNDLKREGLLWDED